VALRREIDQEVDAAEPHGAFGRALREALPDDAIVVGDMTQMDYWGRYGHRVYQPRTYLNPGYQGTLGYAFPTALGVKVAHPDRPVVSISGDGGFGFALQELATAVQHDIGLIAVVFDDGAYGNVRNTQREAFAGHVIASELRNPDFARVADVFGMSGIRAEGAEAFGAALQAAIAHGGPALIEVPVGWMPYPAFFRRAITGEARRPGVGSSRSAGK
jgi:acetolactate synthase-1/2/3 large subunit